MSIAKTNPPTSLFRPSHGKTLVSLTTYGTNNRLLSTTDPYGRKTWYGRSQSSGQLLRTIQEFVPNGISLSDNSPFEDEDEDRCTEYE
jgi:YD repeat-containing protein